MTISGMIIGIVSMLGEIIGVLFLFHRLENREERVYRIIGLACLLILTVIYLPIVPSLGAERIYSVKNLRNQVLRTLINWAAVYGYLRFTKEKSNSVCAYLACLYTLIYMVAFNMRQALQPFMASLGTEQFNAWTTILLLVFQWGCVLAAYFLLELNEIRKIEWSRWPIVIIPIFVELFFKWSLISPGQEYAERPFDLIFYSLCATVGLLFLVILFERNIASQEKRNALQMEQIRLRYEMQNAKRAMQTNTDIRRLYHDMKNHLLALQTMVGKGEEASNYLTELCSQMSDYEANVHTGNSVADALLSEKIERTRLDGITFNICADFSALNHISSVDMVTILGNAVDNAVEALQQLPEGQERIVYIKSAQYANMTVVSISNQFTGNLKMQNGILQTGKTDAEMHGIGLNSIQKAVKRYGGNVETNVDREDCWFRLRIMIPENSISE